MFAKASDFTGGAFFKPADHMNDLALLIEPKRIEKGVPNTYQGQTRIRDEVYADIAVFATSESLDKGEPTETLKNAKVVHGMLTSTLEQAMGQAMVSIVRKIPTKGGSGYVFRDTDASTEAKVADYYTKREAAIGEAMESVPDFD
ncbi:hypothetical protein [Kineococcus esterisolvens]|uniref:hypothetical protein n=1 Tax=unclassified Kineococcus TaxID=2621656 RepID=UPI003D7E9D50